MTGRVFVAAVAGTLVGYRLGTRDGFLLRFCPNCLEGWVSA